jgi:hypothetical protein
MMETIFKRLILEREIAGYELSHARGILSEEDFQRVRQELIQSMPPLREVSEVVSSLFFFFDSQDEVLSILRALRVENPEVHVQEYLNLQDPD